MTAQNNLPEKNSSSPDWDSFRHQMPVVDQWAYFDHAAVSPLPAPTRDALIEWARDAASGGDVLWPNWSRRVESLRRQAAELIAAEPDEIALVRSTTEGINLVAQGFPWRDGDNVITLADEFPTNQYPWLHLADLGVETRRVPTIKGRADLDRVAAACDDRTRVVAVSWVSYSSGWRNDVDRLAQIAHDRGALLMLDAIQGLGVFPLDVGRTPIDFLAADGHKWMLGPEGAGIFFIRREHLDLLRPVGVGWHSVVHDQDFSHIELVFRPSADRYEGGSQNMMGMLALSTSLELLAQYGQEAIAQRVCQITDLACQRLESIGAVVLSDRRPERQSGIVVFDLPGAEPAAARRQCLERKVVLSARAGHLRISPHAYNNDEDIDRLIDALEATRRG